MPWTDWRGTMPEGEHAAIFETYSDAEGVLQVRVSGSEAEIKAYARVMRSVDALNFCIRWADSNTCACAHYGVS